MSRRISTIERSTSETQIKLELALDGGVAYHIKTPHSFFDHMLEAFARHGRVGLEVEAKGDNTGPHHLVEDVGIVLGQAFLAAAGDKVGIERYGDSAVPMDETLVRAVVDFCGRGYLVFDLPNVIDTETGLGMHLVRDFFYALSFNGRFNLHIDVVRGDNPHHIIEACFKATAVALRRALAITGDSLPSTKGKL